MSNVLNIKATIKGKFDLMSTINSVTDHATSNIGGEYPHAQITVGEGSADVRANVKRLAKYTFGSKVFIELGSNFTPQKAEQLAVNIIDEVVAAFRMDVTLSGTVTYVDQITYTTGYEDREHTVRVIDFTIPVNIIESIS